MKISNFIKSIEKLCIEATEPIVKQTLRRVVARLIFCLNSAIKNENEYIKKLQKVFEALEQ